LANNYVVNTRNVSRLLNSIAPCVVTEFKDAAMEYICLQLEAMLENHWIDDLDESLLLELDGVVRGNQLNCLPFAKSGRAELLLHERHPGLAEDLDEERQRRVRDMTFRVHLKDDDSRLSSSFRMRVGSLDDAVFGSPMQDKSRRKSKISRNAPFSPIIRAKDSTMDLMFDMDDDESLGPKSPSPNPVSGSNPLSRNASGTWNEAEACAQDRDHSSISQLSIRYENENNPPPTSFNTKTWSSPVLDSPKLDMREIMAQASSSRVSNLSMSLSAQLTKDQKDNKLAAPKLSQKERKKQQQQVLQQTTSQPNITLEKPDGKPSSPWQMATTGRKTSLKDVLGDPTPLTLSPKPLGSAVPSRSLTPRRTASPDTRFAGQQRNNNDNKKRGTSSSQPQGQPQPSPTNTPHSKSYNYAAGQPEPSLQLSMADIIGQQRREQEVIKEAVAKRSLQEIQEEQAFQQWWDQESKRAQEEEVARAATSSRRSGKGGSTRGKARGRGRGRGDARGRGGARLES
jgi:hypothetical protein